MIHQVNKLGYNEVMKLFDKPVLLVVMIAILSVILMWTPFLLKIDRFWGIDFNGRSMQTIVENFDGINFLVIAKSLYDPKTIEVQYASILSGRQNLYFSAHYPGFPLLIKLFDTILSGPNALLSAIIVSNALLAYALYIFFVSITKDKKMSLYLSVISLFIPARMMSMRMVGSNESLFMFFVLTSLVASIQNKHWIAGLIGSAAVLTRSPGILLFFAYMCKPAIDWYKSRKVEWNDIIPYLLIPLSLVALWIFYGVEFGDFLAYFKVGGNINLYFPPFMIFGSNFDWISGMWLEDIIYTYGFYSIGIGLFINDFGKQKKEFAVLGYFALIYMAMIIFVVHRDISRYVLPISPIIIAGFSKYLNNKYFRYGIFILLIPIVLYSWNFILNNVQPIMDWAPFL